MNYYERHLGDYAKDTGHLSMLEHGAYTLLLDRYYSTEHGIPSDQAYRVARARSRDERAAVESVLAEFFSLIDGVWVHWRAQREIEKAHGKINAARTNGAKGGRPRRNQTPSDNEPGRLPEETKQEPTGFSVGLVSETQAKAHQTPDTRHQTPEYKRAHCAAPPPRARAPDPAEGPDQNPTNTPSADELPPPTAAGIACLAMRHAGLTAVNPSDPRLLALLAQGATTDELADAASAAVARGKPFGWALACVEGRRSDAARIALTAPPPARNSRAHATDEPDWRREQRERNEAFLGPAAASRRTKRSAEIIDMEAIDAAPRQVG